MIIKDGRLFSWRERFNDRELEVEAEGWERFASVLYGVHVVDGTGLLGSNLASVWMESDLV